MIAPKSLSQRQLVVMLSALVALSAILAVGGALLAGSFSQRASDRVLRSAVSAIAETLTVEGDAVQGRVPAGAFTFLEESGQDSVFYNISQGGHVITGYAELPIVPPAEGSVLDFRDDEVLGQDVRVAVQQVILPRQDLRVLVQVGETLNDRRDQTLQMLFAILALELVLVLAAAALIKPAVRWGLKPVERLQSQLGEESVRSLTYEKLETRDVPRELHGLVNAYNQLIARLGDALAAHRRFTGDASHQMRTPLTILKSHLAILQQADITDMATRQSLDDVAAASARLERLLSQLLKLARAEGEDGGRRGFAQADLSTLTAELCRRIAPEALQKGVDIQFDSEGPCIVNTHALVVEEIVWNLIENALQYNREGGEIAVRVHISDEGPAIDVRDTGLGISKADAGKVFQRFFRSARDSATSGSGLGLAIARTLCETVGSRVDLVWSEVGKGSLFRLTFRERLMTAKAAS